MAATAKNNSSKNYYPNDIVIKKIAKTVIHSITVLHMKVPLLKIEGRAMPAPLI